SFVIPCFFFYSGHLFVDPRDLHSFPTRRSSDLERRKSEWLPTAGCLQPVRNSLSAWQRRKPTMRTISNPMTGGNLPDFIMTKASDRKSTRLNSSHVSISYAVVCLKKKKKRTT